ncbi:MAG: helix-turn-helix transcriptional regulator [Kiritimatiellaeota bacterium]|nr:helix-turn-helix transcriptional regulator [Kiritimatiellota bacterium]
MEFDQCACSGKTLSRFVRPVILALLTDGPVHGYDLLRRLEGLGMFAQTPPDTSGVYKTLKTMTAEGLTVGDWDTADPGPARRPFTLTPKGRECLARWGATLEAYQRQIAEISALVSAAVLNATET